MAKNDEQFDIMTKIVQSVPIINFNLGAFQGWGLLLPCYLLFEKAGGLQILRYPASAGLAIADYGFALGCLGSEALRLLQR